MLTTVIILAVVFISDLQSAAALRIIWKASCHENAEKPRSFSVCVGRRRFFSSCLHHVDVVTDDPHRCHSVEHIASILTATDVSSFTLRRFCKWR